MTITDLPSLYATARAEASAGKPVSDDIPLNTCRYCGKFLRQWPGARIDGHWTCAVPMSFQREVYRLYLSDAEMTMQRIADALGVTMNAVARWLRNVERNGARA